MTPHPEKPFNPLDTDQIGESLLRAVLGRPAISMDELPQFMGAGVYAIYYTGPFDAYRLLAEANQEEFTEAIYVGKAIQRGGRKGSMGLDGAAGSPLADRLRQHASSIRSANNLEIGDFYARWLVTEPVWIPLAETLLINRNACVWNAIIDGFGNKDPGVNRHGGRRTIWDTLHPGRWYADLATPGKWTQDAAAQEAATWLAQRL